MKVKLVLNNDGKAVGVTISGTFDEWRHFQIDPNPSNDDKTMAALLMDVAQEAESHV